MGGFSRWRGARPVPPCVWPMTTLRFHRTDAESRSFRSTDGRFLVRPSGARWEIGSADHVTGQLLCQMSIAGMRFDTAELAIAMLGRSMAELSRANAA